MRMIGYAEAAKPGLHIPTTHARETGFGGGVGGDVEDAKTEARKLMAFVEEKESSTLRMYKNFVERMGVERTWRIARNAKDEWDAEKLHASPTLAGKFIKMCKSNSDPLTMEQKCMLERALTRTYEEWTPRMYQEEFAAPALDGENLLVCPTLICFFIRVLLSLPSCVACFVWRACALWICLACLSFVVLVPRCACAF